MTQESTPTRVQAVYDQLVTAMTNSETPPAEDLAIVEMLYATIIHVFQWTFECDILEESIERVKEQLARIRAADTTYKELG